MFCLVPYDINKNIKLPSKIIVLINILSGALKINVFIKM